MRHSWQEEMTYGRGTTTSLNLPQIKIDIAYMPYYASESASNTGF